VERRRRPTRVELSVAPDGLRRGQALGGDVPRAQLFDGRGIGPQAPIRSRSDHEPLGKLVDDLLEILEDESMPFATPPASDDAVRQDDDVLRVLLAVDE
jgi:hypothetical protein